MEAWRDMPYGGSHVECLERALLAHERETVNQCAAVIEDLPVVGAATVPYLAGLKAARNALVALDPGAFPETCSEPEPVHAFFELSYAQYLTIPRTVLQSMPNEWQRRFVTCLEQLDQAIDWRPPEGGYWVLLRDRLGRIVKDWFADYERGRRRVPLKIDPLP